LLNQKTLWRLMMAIVNNEASMIEQLLAREPSLAAEHLILGATRQRAKDFFYKEIAHYLYSGDTPLHAAAAGYRRDIAEQLLKNGASVAAVNRRGATPLHYAADGHPSSPGWNPAAQAEMITLLIKAGANPNAPDKSGVAPLHRSVRQRCASAVDSLLRNGATARLKNKSGSTPLHLAVQNTGKGGSGSPEAKALQREIIELLLKAGANPNDRDGRGKTVRQAAQSNWISVLDPSTERN
jgi:ankyrin repeat protein